MSDKHVLVISEGASYYHPFRKFGKMSRDQSLFDTPEKIALVVFTGGADISPSIYGHRPAKLTSTIPRRDIFELIAFRRAKALNLPLAGICRGAQFLCAVAGGTLIQHVTNHGGDHDMKTWDNRVIEVSSTHHQMMLPSPEAKILGWSAKRLSKCYIGEDDQHLPPPEREVEVAWFPNINAVGMQYHPEMQREWEEGFKFCEELVDKFLMQPQPQAA